jgi:hypothetical protein
MRRIKSATAQPILPNDSSSGIVGYFHGGDPGAAIPTTQLNADWFNGVQGELISIASELGEAESQADLTQCVRAIKNMSNNNLVINGAFNIWQRLTNTGQTTSYSATRKLITPDFGAAPGYVYTADRWVMRNTITGFGVTVSPSLSVPSVTSAKHSFQASILLENTTVGVAAPGQYACLTQHIEGMNMADLVERQSVYSFWVNSTVTGKFAVAFSNSGAGTSPNNTPDRSAVAEFNITTANVWTRVSIQLPAMPTTGNWNYKKGIGLSISHVLTAGDNFKTTGGAWTVGNYLASTGCVDFCATVGAKMAITGCKLTPGKTLGDYVQPGLNDELGLCRRYYGTSNTYDIFDNQSYSTISTTMGDTTSGLTYYRPYFFSTQMRVTPTIYAVQGGSAGFPASPGTISAITPTGFTESRICNASTAGYFYVHYFADSEL